MQASSMHYFPLTWPFLLGLVAVFAVLVLLIELHILKSAYQRMGVPPRYVLGILLLSLLGSAINIPVAQLPQEQTTTQESVDWFGSRYVVPEVHQWPGTIIAVNVGGALIPTLLSLYLLLKNRLFVRGPIAVAIVTVVVHLLAQPVRGVGISVPIFVPPLVAAGTAMILYWRKAPPLAYIAGSLGALIGGDLLNLDKIQGLGAPVASIGGAGTFDGVFLTGIIAVLLCPAASQPPPLVQPQKAAA